MITLVLISPNSPTRTPIGDTISITTSIELSKLKKETTYQMIASMRTSNLSPNTIASYVRVLKAFLRWARDHLKL